MKKIIITLSLTICTLNIGIAQYPDYQYFEVKTPHGTIIGNPNGNSPQTWVSYKFIGTDWTQNQKDSISKTPEVKQIVVQH